MEAQLKRGGAWPAAAAAETSSEQMTARLKLFDATKSPGFVNPDILFTHQPYLNSDGCDRGRNRDLFDEGPIFDEELVLDPNLAAATSSDIDPSNYNSCAPFNRSTNCLSHVAKADNITAPRDSVLSSGSRLDRGKHDHIHGNIPYRGEHDHSEVFQATAAELFDEKPLQNVVWDEELFLDPSSHDGLLLQLAQGGEFLVVRRI